MLVAVVVSKSKYRRSVVGGANSGVGRLWTDNRLPVLLYDGCCVPRLLRRPRTYIPPSPTLAVMQSYLAFISWRNRMLARSERQLICNKTDRIRKRTI